MRTIILQDGLIEFINGDRQDLLEITLTNRRTVFLDEIVKPRRYLVGNQIGKTNISTFINGKWDWDSPIEKSDEQRLKAILHGIFNIKLN